MHTLYFTQTQVQPQSFNSTHTRPVLRHVIHTIHIALLRHTERIVEADFRALPTQDEEDLARRAIQRGRDAHLKGRRVLYVHKHGGVRAADLRAVADMGADDGLECGQHDTYTFKDNNLYRTVFKIQL